MYKNKNKITWLITGFITRVRRRVPLGTQEVLTLSEHLSSPTHSFQWGSCCSVDCFLCSVMWIIVFIFVLFLFAIVLFVLRLTTSDFPFGIFQHFLRDVCTITKQYWCKKLSCRNYTLLNIFYSLFSFYLYADFYRKDLVNVSLSFCRCY